MQYTKNLNLKKPDQNDYVNIADINENMDVLDESVQKKYEKPTTGISKTDLSQPVQDSLVKADNAATQTGLDLTNEALETHNTVTASLKEKGHVQLSNAVNSVSDILAATPKAVKQAYDEAVNATNIATRKKLVIEKFEAPGTFTWTVPKSVTEIFVSGCGGGGGGGTVFYDYSGSPAYKLIPGGSGGITSVGTLLSLTGGSGLGASVGFGSGEGFVRGTSKVPAGGNSLFSTVLNIQKNTGYGFGGESGNFSGNYNVGGSSGASCLDTKLSVTPLDKITLTVGKGGLGGISNSSGTNGANGGDGLLIIKYVI